MIPRFDIGDNIERIIGFAHAQYPDADQASERKALIDLRIRFVVRDALRASDGDLNLRGEKYKYAAAITQAFEDSPGEIQIQYCFNPKNDTSLLLEKNMSVFDIRMGTHPENILSTIDNVIRDANMSFPGVEEASSRLDYIYSQIRCIVGKTFDSDGRIDLARVKYKYVQIIKEAYRGNPVQIQINTCTSPKCYEWPIEESIQSFCTIRKLS